MSIEETILYGILGLTCISSVIIVFYILRNYRLIESHKDSTDAFQEQLEIIIRKIIEEEKEKSKGDD